MFALSLRSPQRHCSSWVSLPAINRSALASVPCILALTLFSSLFVFASRSDAERIDQILRSARAAVGSEDRIAAIRNITAVADCTGPKGKYTTSIVSFRDDRTRFSQTFSYKTEPADIFINGEAVWERKGNEDVYSSAFQRMASRAHEYQKMSFAFEKFFRDLELEGEEVFEGRPSVKLRSRNELGMPADLYFDLETKRFSGYVLHVPNSAERIRNVFLEWRAVDGLMLPSVVRATDSQGDWTLRFHTIRLNRADGSSLRVPPRIADMAELLRLHEQQKTAHLTYNAELFVEMFAENLTQLQRGNSVTRTKAENLARFKTYFAGFKFSEWEDTRPPVIKISKDGTMATKIVQKSVKGTYKNEKGEDQTDHTIFAWLEVWEKIDGRWKVSTVASTERTGDK